jgi:gamma-glutamylcyclotransferase (GGCT)/AIG2-like uncharacterized protein YtfP
MPINHIFVYGTLMKGLDNDHLLEPYAIKRETGYIQGKLYHLMPHGYPALTVKEVGNSIKGELVEIENSVMVLTVLDHLQGYQGLDDSQNLFDRIVIQVRRENGEKIDAYVYVWQDTKQIAKIGKIVTTGNWRTYIETLKDDVLDRYYFAYGACMDEQGRIAASGYAAEFKKVGIARLAGWKLVLNKQAADEKHAYANIEPDSSQAVYGILYRISRRAEREYLNRREGYPYDYYKEYLNVKIGEQEFLSATVYVAMPEHIREGLPVPLAYADELRRGGTVLPTEYRKQLEQLITASLALEN